MTALLTTSFPSEILFLTFWNSSTNNLCSFVCNSFAYLLTGRTESGRYRKIGKMSRSVAVYLFNVVSGASNRVYYSLDKVLIYFVIGLLSATLDNSQGSKNKGRNPLDFRLVH